MKTLKIDIKKLEVNLKDLEKTESLLIKGTTGTDFENDPVKRVKGKMEEQTKDVNDIGKSLNRTVDNSKAALTALKHQKDQILTVIDKTDEAEKAVTLHDQVLDVLQNRELFNRLKLVMIAAFLLFAILLVIYIKFL